MVRGEVMEPFARLELRPKLQPTPGSSGPKFRKKRQAKSQDRMAMINILGMIANLKMSMNKIPFYRQQGQR